MTWFGLLLGFVVAGLVVLFWALCCFGLFVVYITFALSLGVDDGCGLLCWAGLFTTFDVLVS